MEQPQDLTLEDLDDLRITGEKQLTAARVGFLATVYFKNPDAPETRRRLSKCIGTLIEVLGQQLRWAQMGEGERLSAVVGVSPEPYIPAIAATPPEQLVEFSAHSGDKAGDAGHASIYAYAPFDMGGDELGFFGFTMAIGQLEAHPSGMVVNLLAQLCELIKPFHGYAGLGIVRNPNPYMAERAERFVLPLLRRFPGLELDMPATHVLKLCDGIKGINWLTIISDQLAEQMAGRARLAETAVKEGLSVIDFNGGVIIKAGPAPQLGDLEAGWVPELYQKADALLKPLRCSDPDLIIGDDVDGVAAETFSTAWYARFEGGRP